MSRGVQDIARGGVNHTQTRTHTHTYKQHTHNRTHTHTHTHTTCASRTHAVIHTSRTRIVAGTITQPGLVKASRTSIVGIAVGQVILVIASNSMVWRRQHSRRSRTRAPSTIGMALSHIGGGRQSRGQRRSRHIHLRVRHVRTCLYIHLRVRHVRTCLFTRYRRGSPAEAQSIWARPSYLSLRAGPDRCGGDRLARFLANSVPPTASGSAMQYLRVRAVHAAGMQQLPQFSLRDDGLPMPTCEWERTHVVLGVF